MFEHPSNQTRNSRESFCTFDIEKDALCVSLCFGMFLNVSECSHDKINKVTRSDLQRDWPQNVFPS